MPSFELEVRDGAGFTFAFEYRAQTQAEAIRQFRDNCRICGITNFNHYVDSIRKHELDDMRHMAHERPELAAQERGYASRDREQLEIVETILGYLRALSAEGFARDIKGYFAAQKRPDVPTTGKEIKAVRQRKS
jgi:hypothetical protein